MTELLVAILFLPAVIAGLALGLHVVAGARKRRIRGMKRFRG